MEKEEIKKAKESSTMELVMRTECIGVTLEEAVGF